MAQEWADVSEDKEVGVEGNRVIEDLDRHGEEFKVRNRKWNSCPLSFVLEQLLQEKEVVTLLK